MGPGRNPQGSQESMQVQGKKKGARKPEEASETR